MRSGYAVVAVLTICGLSTQAVRSQQSPAQTPQQVVDELLAADRAFSKASAQTDVVSGLSAMFAPDVLMPVPGGRFARGAEEAAAALRGNPANLKARAEWTPIRGGISGDGQHGFTFGYMTTRQEDGTVVPAKYLSYWVRGRDGWRVAGYKRSRATGEKPAPAEMMAPSLPERIVPPSTDAAALERHRKSLDAAERAFSDEAQKIGIGPAFVEFGSADAVNAGPPTSATFIVGSEAIGRSVGSGYESATGSPVSWAPDVAVLVASSGDLGVTFGTIRANAPAPDGKQPPPVPFFTVWRRASPSNPWRYIAE